jgi:hypothetical protein
MILSLTHQPRLGPLLGNHQDHKPLVPHRAFLKDNIVRPTNYLVKDPITVVMSGVVEMDMHKMEMDMPMAEAGSVHNTTSEA